MADDAKGIPPILTPPVPGVPVPPPSDVRWIAARASAGEVPPEHAPKRKTGRPKGSKNVKPRASHVTPGLLPERTVGANAVRGSDQGRRRAEMDQTLSQELWQATYLEYGRTGSVKEIAQRLNVSFDKVRHLVRYGVMRLGLPPIREHAVDYEEVNKRTEMLVGGYASSPAAPSATALVPTSPASPAPLLQNIPDVRQAVTERAIRECAAAQATLQSVVKTSDLLLGYVNKVIEKLVAPDGGYNVPDKISGGLIDGLTKMVSQLATATSKAVETSRLSAGEPTQNIVFHVAAFATQMTPEELRHYALTKEIPAHMRIRGGSKDNTPQPTGIIDTTSEPEPSNGK